MDRKPENMLMADLELHLGLATPKEVCAEYGHDWVTYTQGSTWLMWEKCKCCGISTHPMGLLEHWIDLDGEVDV